MKTYSVGIDEVGRGPVAGLVWVGAVRITPATAGRITNEITNPKSKHPNKLQKSKIDLIYLIPDNILITDSKKMSRQQREKAYEWLKKNAEFYTASVSAKEIDNIGISKAISKAIQKCIKHFDDKAFFFIDGPFDFHIGRPNATIVKGDNKIFEIAAASIVAKVERDNYMLKLAKKYPMYDWENNVGYGTKKHMEAIKKYGMVGEHRRSYLGKIITNRTNDT